LCSGRESVWLRGAIADATSVGPLLTNGEVRAAADRLERLAPLLADIFHDHAWDGRIRSNLLDGPRGTGWLIKGDHDLPVAGSIKARGGLHALLNIIEQIADRHGLPIDRQLGRDMRDKLARHKIVVPSTGNLGYSIGCFARALGLAAEVHMSVEAKTWKKDRLRAIGASVVEHASDYSTTLAHARAAAAHDDVWLIDDEHSRDLLCGYAVAADELASQLGARGQVVNSAHPLVVYLPCGIGGAPGGITHGLKRIYGRHVVTVFVEPTASPCMFVALASGRGATASVYDYGCNNVTIADGLAVPRVSQLVLDAVGGAIDAVVAVPDDTMIAWVGKLWRSPGIRLEPSAAAAFAAFAPLQDAVRARSGWPDLERATHVFWATGGSKLPDEEFRALLEQVR
jgi:D-serine dehydratase